MVSTGELHNDSPLQFALVPYGERIIVRKQESRKFRHIITPDSALELSLIGIVIAVGKNALWAKAGDTVLFGKHAGFAIPGFDGGDFYKDCLLMNNDDLLAKVI